MGSLKIESRLAEIVGKTWMYRTKTYQINDVLLVGSEHIISTDGKTLRIATDKVEEFLNELLPTESALPAKNGVAIPGLDGSIFTELAGGLMTSFREIQGSKDSDFLKQATNRAHAKIQVSKAITDIAKTTIAASKHLGNRD